MHFQEIKINKNLYIYYYNNQYNLIIIKRYMFYLYYIEINQDFYYCKIH
jgi:hypothetical protein